MSTDLSGCVGSFTAVMTKCTKESSRNVDPTGGVAAADGKFVFTLLVNRRAEFRVPLR